MEEIKSALDDGKVVLLHCRAGVHRAALCFCEVMMFLIGITFAQAQSILQDRRYIELEKIINADKEVNKDKEDHTIFFR